MSGISRLKNPIFDKIGLNEWGQRDIIPNDFNSEIIETNQEFQPGTIDASKIKNLNVDTITVSPTGYIRSGKISFTDSTNSGYYLNNEGIYIGAASDTNYLKYTTATGVLDFKGNLISSTITGGTIAIGSSNNIFKADSNGIYLGNAAFASAPFSVDMAGALKATSATVTGAITTGSGSSLDAQYISSSNIINTLTMGSAGTTGYIQSYGWNGSANGFQLKGGTSPALTIIGGTITGGTIQTSSSSNTGVKMTTGGFTAYGTDILTFRDGSGNLRGYMGADSNNVYLIGASGKDVKIGSYQNIYLDAAAGASVLPARANTDLGSSDSANRWRSIYLNGIIYFSGTTANIQYSSSRIQTSSDTQVNGTLYCTGAGEFGTARIKVGAYDFYPTTGAYDASKYYLRS